MKKLFLTFIMAVFAITAFAQNDENQVRTPSGYQGFLEYGNTWHVFDKEMPNNINLSTTHGFYFNEHVFTGIGIGLDFNSDYVLMPIYANIRYVFINNKTVSPVLSLRLGSFMGDKMGAYGDLAFGVRFASKKDFAVSVLLTGTYYDKISENRWIEEYDANGEYISGYSETVQLNPSGVSLRIGIEW